MLKDHYRVSQKKLSFTWRGNVFYISLPVVAYKYVGLCYLRIVTTGSNNFACVGVVGWKTTPCLVRRWHSAEWGERWGWSQDWHWRHNGRPQLWHRDTESRHLRHWTQTRRWESLGPVTRADSVNTSSPATSSSSSSSDVFMHHESGTWWYCVSASNKPTISNSFLTNNHKFCPIIIHLYVAQLIIINFTISHFENISPLSDFRLNSPS